MGACDALGQHLFAQRCLGIHDGIYHRAQGRAVVEFMELVRLGAEARQVRQTIARHLGAAGPTAMRSPGARRSSVQIFGRRKPGVETMARRHCSKCPSVGLAIAHDRRTGIAFW